MPHSRSDITSAKNDYIAAAERLAAILRGALQAIENGQRAAAVVDEEPMTLANPVHHSTIKDLAGKMGG